MRALVGVSIKNLAHKKLPHLPYRSFSAEKVPVPPKIPQGASMSQNATITASSGRIRQTQSVRVGYGALAVASAALFSGYLYCKTYKDSEICERVSEFAFGKKLS